MIISSLIGGLGNQMFQYAAAFVAAKYARTELYVDNLYYKDKSKRFHHFCYRPYALDLFKLHCEVATPSDIMQFTYPRIHNKYLFHFLRHFHKDKNIYDEIDINSFQKLSSLPKNCYIKGFFQKYEYIQHDINDIKSEFTFKTSLPYTHKDIVKLIKQEEEPICVVFRRGDYVGHPSLDVVTLEYYHDALKLLKENKKKGKVFVFSDDIPWCKKNFKPNNHEVSFVDQKFTGYLGGYYLQLMMLCHHFIIPNSTYPYWAALLSSANDNKIVIAPKVWYKGQNPNNRNDILPPNWIAL